MALIIATEELVSRLESGGERQFWNVLTDDYFTGEMLPGSERVPLDKVGREVSARRLAKDAEIVVYCSGPTCPQSGQAAKKLTKLGYTNVLQFEGGLEHWKASGREVVPVAEERAA